MPSAHKIDLAMELIIIFFPRILMNDYLLLQTTLSNFVAKTLFFVSTFLVFYFSLPIRFSSKYVLTKFVIIFMCNVTELELPEHTEYLNILAIDLLRLHYKIY